MAALLMLVCSSAFNGSNSSILNVMFWMLLATGPVFVSFTFVGKALIKLFSGNFQIKNLPGILLPVAFMVFYFFPVSADNDIIFGPLFLFAMLFSAIYTLTGLVLASRALFISTYPPTND